QHKHFDALVLQLQFGVFCAGGRLERARLAKPQSFGLDALLDEKLHRRLTTGVGKRPWIGEAAVGRERRTGCMAANFDALRNARKLWRERTEVLLRDVVEGCGTWGEEDRRSQAAFIARNDLHA